jgi:ankyrin repeat protein
MNNELLRCAESGDLEMVKQLVEGGADIEELGIPYESVGGGKTALMFACIRGHFAIVVYLLERSANIAYADCQGMTALHWASYVGNLPIVKYLLERGAQITARSNDGMTALLCAAQQNGFEVVQYLLSSEGGASITETDNKGSTALVHASFAICSPLMVQWLLEYGGAEITETDNKGPGTSVWCVFFTYSLSNLLKRAYAKGDDGEYVSVDWAHIEGTKVPTGDINPRGGIRLLTSMLRVMVLHSSPPESVAKDLAPPFQRIVQDGARLRARLPAYLAQRRVLIDAHCPLLPPLHART